MPDESANNSELHPQVRIVLRPLASPLPLGFFGFAIGTVLLAAFELNWIPPAQSLGLIVIILAFSAPLELMSSILGFLMRDAGAAVSMGVFGSGWVALSLFYLFYGPEAHAAVVAIYLFTEALVIFAIAIASLSGKPLLSLVLALAGIRFILSACWHLGASDDLKFAAGAIGLLLGALAIYAGLAFLLEEVKHKPVLPHVPQRPGPHRHRRQPLRSAKPNPIRSRSPPATLIFKQTTGPAYPVPNSHSTRCEPSPSESPGF
jgi:succinate-acetate transporter protein